MCVGIWLKGGVAVGKHHLSLNLLIPPFLSPPHRSVKPPTRIYTPWRVCIFNQQARPASWTSHTRLRLLEEQWKPAWLGPRSAPRPPPAANNNIWVVVLTLTYQFISPKTETVGEKAPTTLTVRALPIKTWPSSDRYFSPISFFFSFFSN